MPSSPLENIVYVPAHCSDIIPCNICDHWEVRTTWKKEMCAADGFYNKEHGVWKRMADLNLSSLYPTEDSIKHINIGLPV